MSELDKLKLQLNIKDNKQDDMLSLLLEDSESFLRLLIDLQSDNDMPAELTPVIRGAAIVRYNRLNNEGMQSYSQDGESITFSSSDFDSFKDEINAWKQNHQGSYTTLIEDVNPYAV